MRPCALTSGIIKRACRHRKPTFVKHGWQAAAEAPVQAALKGLGANLEWEGNAGMRRVHGQWLANGGGALKLAIRNPANPAFNLVLGLQVPEGRLPLAELLPRLQTLAALLTDTRPMAGAAFERRFNEAMDALMVPTVRLGGQFSVVYNLSPVLSQALVRGAMATDNPALTVIAGLGVATGYVLGTSLRVGASLSLRSGARFTAGPDTRRR